jgi:hypothetical protein
MDARQATQLLSAGVIGDLVAGILILSFGNNVSTGFYISTYLLYFVSILAMVMGAWFILHFKNRSRWFLLLLFVNAIGALIIYFLPAKKLPPADK